MSDVSVIGIGAMGSALAVAVAASGAGVTVWNRTREKAEAVAGPRVRLADQVDQALRSSPLTVLSVSDHRLARTLVEEAGEDLAGRVVASTSFATPDQAQAFQAAVAAAGGATWICPSRVPQRSAGACRGLPRLRRPRWLRSAPRVARTHRARQLRR